MAEFYGAGNRRKPCNTERWREYARENREVVGSITRQYAARNPEKRSAWKAVENAVCKGLLQKPKRCEACGRSVRLDGHHADYAKPLEVEWLCPRCHTRAHHREAA
jgi:hypothetical protein